MRKFVIKAGRGFESLKGIEFETEDDANEEEIAKAAYEVVCEWLDYSWEEVDK